MDSGEDIQSNNVPGLVKATNHSSNQNNHRDSDSNDNALTNESRGAKPKVRILNIPNGSIHAPKLNNNSLIRHCDSDQLIDDPYNSQDNVDKKSNFEKCPPTKVQCTKCITCFNIRENNLCFDSNKYHTSQISKQHNCGDGESNIKVNNTSHFLENKLGSSESQNRLTAVQEDFSNLDGAVGGFQLSNQPSSSGLNIQAPSRNGSATNKLCSKRARDSRNNDSDDSSDTGNDDASLDECCIYTYRDRQNHELPQQEVERGNSGTSSPEMDFLEMDFDPGPSCEAGSTDEASSELEFEQDQELNVCDYRQDDIENNHNEDYRRGAIDKIETEQAINFPKPVEQELRNDLSMPGPSNCYKNDFNVSQKTVINNIYVPVASTSSGIVTDPDTSSRMCSGQKVVTPRLCNTGWARRVNGEMMFVQRTCASWPMRECPGHQNSGDLVSPRDVEMNKPEDLNAASVWAESRAVDVNGQNTHSMNLSSALFHCTMAKRLMHGKNVDAEGDSSNVDFMIMSTDSNNSSAAAINVVPKTMIWTEQEAVERQVTQISTSACGATAVINVFVALNIAVDIDKINQSVKTRLRQNDAQVPQYLLSRSRAGCTHQDIMNALEEASDGQIVTKFFPMFPERLVSLSYWLAYWISNGCIPVATLNLQVGTNSSEIPDAWHHQMVFGVGRNGVYLTNPLQCVNEGALWHQLCSDSTLLIRSSDILSRWNRNTDLTEILRYKNKRWQKMNVIGQVVNLLRESQSTSMGRTRTSHIKIPAEYKAGITFAAIKDSKGATLLKQCEDLPIVE